MRKTRIPESIQYWQDLALFYCSKRETSRPRLRAYFLRKFREYGIPADQIPLQTEWIEAVLDDLEKKKIIDHERYAGILQRDLQRRGKGKRYLTQKMKERGLEDQIPELQFDPESELDRARDLAVKTLKKGSIQKLEDPFKIKTKLLQKLIASGFELSLAKKAVEHALNDWKNDLTGEPIESP